MAASLSTGRRLLTTVDDYVRSQSGFDRQARVNLQREVVEVTQAIYLDYVASQVMTWSPDELEALRTIVSAVSSLFAPPSLRLPAQIHLVTDLGPGGGIRGVHPAAGHHRAAGEHGRERPHRWRATVIRSTPATTCPICRTSSCTSASTCSARTNPRPGTGYISSCTTEFSTTRSSCPTSRGAQRPRLLLRDLKITNPDEPGANVCIELVVPSDPAEPSSPPAPDGRLAPILLANGPYAGGVFFEYLQWWFLAIEEDATGVLGAGPWQGRAPRALRQRAAYAPVPQAGRQELHRGSLPARRGPRAELRPRRKSSRASASWGRDLGRAVGRRAMTP